MGIRQKETRGRDTVCLSDMDVNSSMVLTAGMSVVRREKAINFRLP